VTNRDAFFDLARRAWLPAISVTVIGYFAFHAVAGNTGMIAWQGYKAERTTLERQANAVKSQRVALERQTALLDPRHVDPDLADELVRRNLGVVSPDEVIVDLPPAG